MSLDDNKNLILNLIKQRPDMGKTALMKFVFFLQESFGMDLEYDFNIYTYGPYDGEVLEDLDIVTSVGLVDTEFYIADGYSGYKLNLTENSERIVKDLLKEDQDRVGTVIRLFGHETANRLELLSTIVYVANKFERHDWGKDGDTIFGVVKGIKPHFEVKTIENAYNELLGHGIIREG